MKKHLARIADTGKKHLDDILYALATVLIGFGIWLVYPPAALIFVGLVSCALAFLVGIHQRKASTPEEGN